MAGVLCFGGALIGVMFQWYLFYIEVAVLRAYCYWCVTSQTIITVTSFCPSLSGAPGLPPKGRKPPIGLNSPFQVNRLTRTSSANEKVRVCFVARSGDAAPR